METKIEDCVRELIADLNRVGAPVTATQIAAQIIEELYFGDDDEEEE